MDILSLFHREKFLDLEWVMKIFNLCYLRNSLIDFNNLSFGIGPEQIFSELDQLTRPRNPVISGNYLITRFLGSHVALKTLLSPPSR